MHVNILYVRIFILNHNFIEQLLSHIILISHDPKNEIRRQKNV